MKFLQFLIVLLLITILVVIIYPEKREALAKLGESVCEKTEEYLSRIEEPQATEAAEKPREVVGYPSRIDYQREYRENYYYPVWRPCGWFWIDFWCWYPGWYYYVYYPYWHSYWYYTSWYVGWHPYWYWTRWCYDYPYYSDHSRRYYNDPAYRNIGIRKKQLQSPQATTLTRRGFSPNSETYSSRISSGKLSSLSKSSNPQRSIKSSRFSPRRSLVSTKSSSKFRTLSKPSKSPSFRPSSVSGRSPFKSSISTKSFSNRSLPPRSLSRPQKRN